MPVVNPGIRRYIGSAIQRLFNSASFSAPLTHSLVLERGTGTPTYTNTSVARSVQDHEGVLRTAIAGEARFTGARRVDNIWGRAAGTTLNMPSDGGTTNSGGVEVVLNQGYAPDGTLTADVLRDNTGSANTPWYLVGVTSRTSPGSTYLFSIYLQTVSGNSETVGLTLWDNVAGFVTTNVVVTGTLTRYTCIRTFNSASTDRRVGFSQINPVSTTGVYCSWPQIEDITGRTDQTTPSEYVSVGATPINLCLQSNAFTTTWTDISSGATQNATGPDGGTTAWTLTDNSAVVAEGVYQNITLTAAAYTWSVFVKKTSGATTYPLMYVGTGATAALATLDTNNGVATAWTSITGGTILGGVSARCSSYNSLFWRFELTYTATAAVYFHQLNIASATAPTYAGPTIDVTAQGSAVFYGAQVELGSFATTYIPTTTVAKAYNEYHGSGVDGVKYFDTDLSGNPLPTAATYEYAQLNGVAGTYVSTPDSVANSITGDIDIRFDGDIDWTPSSAYGLVDKLAGAGLRSYLLRLNPTGTLQVYWSVDGTALLNAESTASNTLTSNTRGQVKATLDVDNGAGGKTVRFYQSTDLGVTWTQIGTDVTTAGTTSIFNTTQTVSVGFDTNAATYITGKIYAAQIYNGINGTLAVDFDASRYAGGTTLTGSTGETWTLNGSAYIPETNFPMKGYLAEAAGENKCLQSQNLSTTWVAASLVSFVADQYVAPDGTTTMDKVLATAGNGGHYFSQTSLTTTAAAYTYSVYLRYDNHRYVALILNDAVGNFYASFDLLNGTAGAVTAGVTSTITQVSTGVYRVTLTKTVAAAAGTATIYGVLNNSDNAGIDTWNAAGTEAIGVWGAQVELGSAATSYKESGASAGVRNADVDSVPTSGNILAAAGTIALTYTPTSASSGTRFLWGTYVDASNYTAILHDATNLIFRKRIAGVNTDATIGNAFVSGTAYKMCASWGAAGQTIYLNGTAGTPHANTASAQIAATMQIGADGNSLQQPNMNIGDVRVWTRQTSGSEQAAVTR